MKKNIILIAVLIIVAIVGATFLMSEKKSTGDTKIKFGVMKIPWSAPVVISHEKGFFKKHGIDSEIITFNTGKEALDAVIRGQVDVATVAETPIAHLAFQNQGDIKIFTNMTKAYDIVIAARGDLGISLPNDISGKKVSAIKGAAPEYALNIFLTENNIVNTDYIHLDPIVLIPSLANGDVVAAILWEPLLSRAKEALGNKIVTFEIKNYIGTFNLLSKNQYIQENERAVQKIVDALVETSEFISKNLEESKTIVSKFTEIDRKIVDEAWSKYSFKINPPSSILKTLEKQGQWIMGQDSTKTQLPNYSLFLTDSFFK